MNEFIRFAWNGNLQQSFALMTRLLKNISYEKKHHVEVTLFLWNNNLGLEFALLQSVFREKIPLAYRNETPNNPVAKYFAEPFEIVELFLIAIAVDASFQIRCPDFEFTLVYQDEVMEVSCSKDTRREVEELLIDGFKVEQF